MNTDINDLRLKAFLEIAKNQAKELSSKIEKLAISEIDNDLHDPKAWVHLASCYMSDGNFEKATEPLEIAYLLRPPALSREWLLMLADFGVYFQEICKLQSAMGRSLDGRERLEKLLQDMATFQSGSPDNSRSESEMVDAEIEEIVRTYSDSAKKRGKKSWWKFWK